MIEEVTRAAEFLRVYRSHSNLHLTKMAVFIGLRGGMTGERRLQNRHTPFTSSYADNRRERGWESMDIRFVSSLTSEDEKLFAPALLKAVAALLDQLPIAYTVRIETTGADVFQHAHAVAVEEPAKADIFEAASGNGNGRGTSHYLGRVAHS